MTVIHHPLLQALYDSAIQTVIKETGLPRDYLTAELTSVLRAVILESYRLGSEDLTPPYGKTLPPGF